MWWPRRRRKPNGGAATAAAESQAKAKAAKRATPMYETLAEHIANLPPEEFAERVARAFGGRHA